MTNTQQVTVNDLSLQIESEYMDGMRTVAEAIATALVHSFQGEFCRRHLGYEDEFFTKEEVEQAIRIWADRTQSNECIDKR